jgi:hypothetical protein
MLTQVEKSHFTNAGNGASAATVLAEALHLPRKPWWERLFTWEKLSVAGKEVKGLVVTPTMGLTIFLALGTVIGGMYYRTTGAIEQQSQEMRDIRDMTIEMKTRLDERTSAQKEAESERKREQRAEQDEARIWRETMGRRMDKVELVRR